MKLALILSLLIFSSCSQFYTGRTFLSEMEHDDSSFFNPRQDFPVVAGDTGEYWMSETERKQRTPTSEKDLADYRFRNSLEEELRNLEGSQPEHSLKLYDQYRDRLGSTSEKIYFLKLPYSERHHYLESRGLMSSGSRSPASMSSWFGVRREEVSLGMGKEQVLESMGRPLRVEIAGNPSFENERWVYSLNGATKYIYFESGRVGGWE